MQHLVKQPKAAIIYAAVAGLCIWLTLILQVCISVPAFLAAGRSFGGSVVQLLSFFTILSNLLAAVAFSAALFKPSAAFSRFFQSRSALTAIVLYITIVGLVYNVVLRSLWHPVGLFKLADELLHCVNPALFIIYWLFFSPRQGLTYTQALSWLWFPLLYLVYILIRGAISHLYPYPFLDAYQLGYQQVIINSLMMLVAFAFFDALFLFINRGISSK